MAPEYQGLRKTSATVMIMPFISSMINENQKKIIFDRRVKNNQPMTSAEENFFNAFMPPILADYTIAEIISVDSAITPDDIKFAYKELKNKKNQAIEAFIPSSGVFTYKGKTPDFMLIVENLYFLKTIVDKETFVGSGSSSNFAMETGMDYVLWDNKKAKICSFGRLHKKLTLVSLPEKMEYLSVFNEFAVSIIKNTPLVPKDIRF